MVCRKNASLSHAVVVTAVLQQNDEGSSEIISIYVTAFVKLLLQIAKEGK